MDWKALAPHQPLRVDEISASYVPRPSGGAQDLVARIRARLDRPIAVAGPAGCGKSTELAATAHELRNEAFCWLVPVERAFSAGLPDSSVIERLALALSALVGDRRRAALSTELRGALGEIEAELELGAETYVAQTALRGQALLRSVLKELAAMLATARVVVLGDGLERLPISSARAVARSLATLADVAAIVVVLPPGLVLGPESYEIVSEYRVHSVGPLPLGVAAVLKGDDAVTAAAEGVETRKFLREVVRRRLSLGDDLGELRNVVEQATDLSGGIVRVFLQLVQQAGDYATLSGREIPNAVDFRRAADDQADTLFRLLKEGDKQLLREADGTDGSEVPIDRRIRYLSHGLLLEHQLDGRHVCTVAPLVRNRLK